MNNGNLLFDMLIQSCDVDSEFDMNTALVFKDYLLENVTMGLADRFISKDSKYCLLVFNNDMDDGDSYGFYYHYLNNRKVFVEYSRYTHYVVSDNFVYTFKRELCCLVKRRKHDSIVYGGRFA